MQVCMIYYFLLEYPMILVDFFPDDWSCSASYKNAFSSATKFRPTTDQIETVTANINIGHHNL